MVLIDSVKLACETCIRGHRSSGCTHTDRPLFEIKKKGRPVTQCEHCRQLRKTKQVHVKCMCEAKTLDSSSASKPAPRALSHEPRSATTSTPGCTCNLDAGACHCCTPRNSSSASSSIVPNDACSGTRKKKVESQTHSDISNRIPSPTPPVIAIRDNAMSHSRNHPPSVDTSARPSSHHSQHHTHHAHHYAPYPIPHRTSSQPHAPVLVSNDTSTPPSRTESPSFTGLSISSSSSISDSYPVHFGESFTPFNESSGLPESDPHCPMANARPSSDPSINGTDSFAMFQVAFDTANMAHVDQSSSASSLAFSYVLGMNGSDSVFRNYLDLSSPASSSGPPSISSSTASRSSSRYSSHSPELAQPISLPSPVFNDSLADDENQATPHLTGQPMMDRGRTMDGFELDVPPGAPLPDEESSEAFWSSLKADDYPSYFFPQSQQMQQAVYAPDFYLPFTSSFATQPTSPFELLSTDAGIPSNEQWQVELDSTALDGLAQLQQEYPLAAAVDQSAMDGGFSFATGSPYAPL